MVLYEPEMNPLAHVPVCYHGRQERLGHTTNPGQNKAEDLTSHNGEIPREHASKVTSDRDGVAAKVCSEGCESLLQD